MGNAHSMEMRREESCVRGHVCEPDGGVQRHAVGDGMRARRKV